MFIRLSRAPFIPACFPVYFESFDEEQMGFLGSVCFQMRGNTVPLSSSLSLHLSSIRPSVSASLSVCVHICVFSQSRARSSSSKHRSLQPCPGLGFFSSIAGEYGEGRNSRLRRNKPPQFHRAIRILWPGSSLPSLRLLFSLYVLLFHPPPAFGLLLLSPPSTPSYHVVPYPPSTPSYHLVSTF